MFDGSVFAHTQNTLYIVAFGYVYTQRVSSIRRDFQILALSFVFLVTFWSEFCKRCCGVFRLGVVVVVVLWGRLVVVGGSVGGGVVCCGVVCCVVLFCVLCVCLYVAQQISIKGAYTARTLSVVHSCNCGIFTHNKAQTHHMQCSFQIESPAL